MNRPGNHPLAHPSPLWKESTMSRFLMTALTLLGSLAPLAILIALCLLF